LAAPSSTTLSRFAISGIPEQETLSLVFENAEMSNIDAFNKDWLLNETLHRFRISNFASLRILMEGFRLSNLQNPKIVNKVLTPPGDKYATCFLHHPLSLAWILSSCHSSFPSFRDLNEPPTTVCLHSEFTNPDLPK
jgi:hypothetical protein